MSTEARLRRLGLWHLRDKPEELQRELQKRTDDYDAKVAAWHEERKVIVEELRDLEALVEGIGCFTEARGRRPGRWSTIVFATWTEGDRPVAVKIPRLVADSPMSDAASLHHTIGRTVLTGSNPPWDVQPDEVLRHQIELLGSIDDPIVLPLLAHGETGAGMPYAVFPRIEDRTLRHVTTDTGRSLTTRICAEIASGLARLGAAGALRMHGDVKPDNILIGDDWQPRLIDPSTIHYDANGLPNAYLYTPAYGPSGGPTDAAGVAITAVETRTGTNPFTVDGLVDRPAKDVGPLLQMGLRYHLMHGNPWQHLARIPLPTELDEDLGERWDTMLLGALGAEKRPDGSLEALPSGPISMETLAALLEELA